MKAVYVDNKGVLKLSIQHTFELLKKLNVVIQIIDEQLYIYQVNGKIVKKLDKNDCQNMIIEYIYEVAKKGKNSHKGQIVLDEIYKFYPKTVIDVFNHFGWSRLLTDFNFNLLPTIEIKRQRHKKDEAHYYFKNGFVTVTKKEIKLNDYSLLNHYVLESNIIQQNVILAGVSEVITDKIKTFKGLSFLDFIEKTCSEPTDEPTNDTINNNNQNYLINDEKLKKLCIYIGYMLHDYKEQGATDFAVWLTDNEQGGTGKDLILQGVSKLVKVSSVDCTKQIPDFDPMDLNENTVIKHMQDVRSTYSLREEFNEITSKNRIRHIYKAPRYIDYKDGFKFVFTANYFPKGSDSSDMRRLQPFLINPFFSHQNKVYDYYGHSFFGDQWNEFDFSIFYYTMFKFVQAWLNTDFKLENIAFVDKSYLAAKVESQYSTEFNNFFSGLKSDWYVKSELHQNFMTYVQTNGVIENEWNRQFKTNKNLFTRVLKSYLNDNSRKFKENANRTNILIL